MRIGPFAGGGGCPISVLNNLCLRFGIKAEFVIVRENTGKFMAQAQTGSRWMCIVTLSNVPPDRFKYTYIGRSHNAQTAKREAAINALMVRRNLQE